jgi:hypothetical protein
MSLLKRIRILTRQDNNKTEREPKRSLAIDKNSSFIYRGGSDVMTTWKKTGWIPPSETRTDFLFKKNRDNNDR